ncbi:ubiquitin carboxyl-terminal hydrolase 28-like [Artibeus jamaicensis]|uniref:ubiquitin carboxyl-terminal hydrolase 28-like n=1 Tax=Artibeus jamaicensis TaxID=9417 RepID=UPI00235A94C5|nr:ubiquitin carboxyl-terminal hydrolase 28-like [Artibeus jamaicensis]
MEPMLVVFICSQFAWGIVAFILVGLYFRVVRNCHSSRFRGSPLGQIIGELIFYCNSVWPTYVLDCGEKWPVNGSLSYCTIMQLNLYCQKLGKWDEIPYVRAFISLQNKVSSRAGNPLLLQRKEEASKLELSDHKTKESFSVRNPEERRSVGGRSLPCCPVKLGWRLSTTMTELQTELQEDGMGGAAGSHDASYQMEVDQQSEDQGIRAPPLPREGLKAMNGDVPLAGSLTRDRVKEPDPDAIATEERAGAANKKAFARVLGLARKRRDELDAAIALSLLNSSKCHTEGKTLRRHNTVSADTKRSKRRHFEVWGENRNPNDWKRVDGWPVGLKNVGNTCWFSVVIQSLFQLPEFRRVVLGSTVPQDALENCTDEREKRNVMFMQELQRLFALMMGSNRKFVDPSSALNLLKGAFQSDEEEQQQQDVSEFTHKLLDWLEDAFHLTVVADSNLENPMMRLFYGTVLTEGVREGKLYTNSETFGLYPLQVNGYCNLQECLDGAMVEGDIELLPSNQSTENGQEYWFTKLPPVLTFELSRFEFNQSLGQPEKIHNKLEFPPIIYMDRYMHRNKDLVQSKRQCVRRLKEEIVLLQEKMEKYVKYDLDPAQSPLLNVASQSDSSVTLPLSSVTGEGNSPQSVASVFSEDCLCKSTTKNKPLPSSQSSGEMPAQPVPQTVTDEINFKTCLQKLSSETEQDVQDLKNFIASTTQAIQQMYCDPLLSQVPYRLHAVLVHEGQADAGHYWVYIYNQPRQVWLKYNDISVTESSWEELESDSYGGSRNASAYCLMYIKDQPPNFNADATPSESEQMLGELEGLSDELKRYIEEDNWRFEQEIEEWEEEQSRKISQMELSDNLASQDFPTSQQPSGASCGVRSLSSGHAVMFKEESSQDTANPTRAYGKSGVGAIQNEEYSRPY